MPDRGASAAAPRDGVLVIDKPQGLTSHDAVVRVRRVLGVRRVGHLGTLDPLATGVLPLVVGRATRLAALLTAGPKTYDAVIRLGMVTDTYDVTGTVAPASGPSQRIDRGAVEAASRAFTGSFRQQPPPFSAKKVGGVRAYRLARRRESVELRPVDVTVHRFEVLALSGDRLRCRVSCSPGFYLRTLAHDLGRDLGCGACLESLRRERSGAFTLDAAVRLDEMESGADGVAPRMVAMADLLPELPSVVVTGRGAARTAHGNTVVPGDVRSRTSAASAATAAGKCKVYDDGGRLLAIAEQGPGGALHPRIVLV